MVFCRFVIGYPERYALAETIGADGFQLWRWIYAPGTPLWVRQIPAVEVLRQVWSQQFCASENIVRSRVADDLPLSSIDLRRSRYLDLAKTHLQNLITAAALNLQRVADWLAERATRPNASIAFCGSAIG